ncbi:MAG: type II toxin-antitoxin system HicB family antitoxin [Anaerolineae bacterium]|nr:type II toxin-antitoxin system HicB family antitoxin [Anaerolineae bacterium]
MANKDLSYYMGLPYRIEVYKEADENGYTAAIPELPGCLTYADTPDELFEMVEDAKRAWLETALEDGDYIPEPAPTELEEYSGRFLVRLPKTLHSQLANRATREGTSLNQLVVMMLSESMGRWTERQENQTPHNNYGESIKPFNPDSFATITQSWWKAVESDSIDNNEEPLFSKPFTLKIAQGA